jgi:hypothetical protein
MIAAQQGQAIESRFFGGLPNQLFVKGTFGNAAQAGGVC